MATQSRLFPTFVGAALLVCMADGVQAQELTEKPTKAQLPSQIIPTGEEDAPSARSVAARSATSATAAAARQARLESDLIRMTSESSEGLSAVKQSDGSTRMDLEGRFMSVVVTMPTSDGGNEVTCHVGQDALEKVRYARQVSAAALPKSTATKAASAAAPALLEEK